MQDVQMEMRHIAIIVAILLLVSSGFAVPVSGSSINSGKFLLLGKFNPEDAIYVATPGSPVFTNNPAPIGFPPSSSIQAAGYIGTTAQAPPIALQAGQGDPVIVGPLNAVPPVSIKSFTLVSGNIEWNSRPDFQIFSPYSTVTAAIPGLWLDSTKRRTRSQIYIEILELMKRGPMTPFEIAFYARLNRKRTKEYTEFLKNSGYLQEELEEKTGKKVYVLTNQGFLFLERMKDLFQNKLSPSEIPWSPSTRTQNL